MNTLLTGDIDYKYTSEEQAVPLLLRGTHPVLFPKKPTKSCIFCDPLDRFLLFPIATLLLLFLSRHLDLSKPTSSLGAYFCFNPLRDLPA